MKRFKLSDIEALSQCPAINDSEWLSATEDSISYLKSLEDSDEIVIYASGASLLIHGALAPLSKVTPPDIEDLNNGRFPDLEDCWRIQRVWGGGQGHRIYIEPPLQSSASKSFIGGEKLIYRRPFDGINQPASIELSQKLVHSLELHYMPERKAYCRLDRTGEIEDVIRVYQRQSDNFLERFGRSYNTS